MAAEKANFEYIEPDQRGLQALSNDLKSVFMPKVNEDLKLFAEHTPVAPCVRCGTFTFDPLRRLDHERIHDAEFASEEEKQAVCDGCLIMENALELEDSVLELLERRLNLSEKDRDSLKSLLETVFTDPQKIVKVADLENRVRSLERQTNVLWAAFGGAIIALLVSLVALVVSAAA